MSKGFCRHHMFPLKLSRRLRVLFGVVPTAVEVHGVPVIGAVAVKRALVLGRHLTHQVLALTERLNCGIAGGDSSPRMRGGGVVKLTGPFPAAVVCDILTA